MKWCLLLCLLFTLPVFSNANAKSTGHKSPQSITLESLPSWAQKIKKHIKEKCKDKNCRYFSAAFCERWNKLIKKNPFCEGFAMRCKKGNETIHGHKINIVRLPKKENNHYIFAVIEPQIGRVVTHWRSKHTLPKVKWEQKDAFATAMIPKSASKAIVDQPIYEEFKTCSQEKEHYLKFSYTDSSLVQPKDLCCLCLRPGARFPIIQRSSPTLYCRGWCGKFNSAFLKRVSCFDEKE